MYLRRTACHAGVSTRVPVACRRFVSSRHIVPGGRPAGNDATISAGFLLKAEATPVQPPRAKAIGGLLNRHLPSKRNRLDSAEIPSPDSRGLTHLGTCPLVGCTFH